MSSPLPSPIQNVEILCCKIHFKQFTVLELNVFCLTYRPTPKFLLMKTTGLYKTAAFLGTANATEPKSHYFQDTHHGCCNDKGPGRADFSQRATAL